MEDNWSSNVVGNKETVTLPDFKDIRKPTISETYKYFNKLLKGKTIANLNECLSVTRELPLFDESLRLMLIDSLHLRDEVLKILLSQNDRQIKRILQCDWFFQDLPADFCTTQIFPFVSLSVRCKIINKLSRNLNKPEEAEKYFTFLRAKYGNARANFLLPRCSQKFILSYLEETKTLFYYDGGSRIIMNISKRYPEVGIKILSSIYSQKGIVYDNFSKYRKIILYLSGYHPELMVPFLKEFSSVIPQSTFGRKLTKKLIPNLKDCLYPNYMKRTVFHNAAMFLLLSPEEQIKLIATFVQFQSTTVSSSSWCNSSHIITAVLKVIPQDKRQHIMESAFQQVFNLNFKDHPNFWCGQLLELLPTKSRTPFVEKIEEAVEGGPTEFKKNLEFGCFSFKNPENYLYLYDSSVAFKKLQEVLRKTPALHRRESILVHLVKSCKINNDLKTLEEVVDFVATRHRNDDSSVIFPFIDEIFNSFPDSSLNPNVFQKLEDLAYFMSLKGRGREYMYNQWKEKHILYCLENNINVESQMKSCFEDAIVKDFCCSLVQNYESKLAKEFTLAACKEAMNWLENKPPGYSGVKPKDLIIKMVNTCCFYNWQHKNNKIKLREVPGLEKLLKESLKENFAELGCENWSIDVWERFYNEVGNDYYKPKCMFFVFKRNPNWIEKYLEEILKVLFSQYQKNHNSFVIFLKHTASFFGFSEKLKQILLNEFENGDLIRKRKIALEILSHVCTIEEFTKIVENYIPKQERVEKGAEGGFDEIQMKIPTLIKHIIPGWKNLDLILKFLFGDFLKSVLPSFNSCLCKTRCDVALPFLKKRLEEVPPKVSYIKDIIRLILDLSDRDGKTEFCLFCWEKYKHYSVRMIVLGYVSRFFLDRPTPESFQVLEKCVLDCDETTIEAAPEMHRIPKEFFNVYVDALWRFSENQKPNFRKNYRETLLSRFDEHNIELLSTEFCESVIKKNLFNQSAEFPVHGFTTLYLMSKPEGRRIMVILDLIKDVKAGAGPVYRFLEVLLTEANKKPAVFADVFTVLLENWPEFSPGVLTQEKILFRFHNIRQKLVKRMGDSVFVELGKELRKFFSGVEDLNEFFHFYVEALKKFFGDIGTSEALETLKGFVEGSLDRSTALLAVLSLPEGAVSWLFQTGVVLKGDIKGKKDLEEIIKALEGCSDGVVEAYLRSKIEFSKTYAYF